MLSPALKVWSCFISYAPNTLLRLFDLAANETRPYIDERGLKPCAHGGWWAFGCTRSAVVKTYARFHPNPSLPFLCFEDKEGALGDPTEVLRAVWVCENFTSYRIELLLEDGELLTVQF